MKVRPTALRACICEQSNGLQITIPARRNWFHLLFVGFWLCGWSVGWVSAATQLTTGRAVLFLIGWLGAWTIGGLFALLGWLWNLAGEEVLISNTVRCAAATNMTVGKSRTCATGAATSVSTTAPKPTASESTSRKPKANKSWTP